MKKGILLFLFLLSNGFYYLSYAQNSMQYVYDNTGNRISRLLISTRSFTPYSSEKQEEELNPKSIAVKINIYPNPVESELIVAISELPENKNWELVLYDINGKIIYREKYTSAQVTIPMDRFSTGNYIVKLIYERTQSIWKIIKK